MKQGQDLYDVTARVLTGMREVLKEVKPDVVLVHGDTTTSTAAALATFYQQIPVGHVEAGLRTHNIYISFEILVTCYFLISDKCIQIIAGMKTIHPILYR